MLRDIFSEDKSILEEIERKIISTLSERIKKNISLMDSFFVSQSKMSDSQIIQSRSKIIKRAEKLVTDTKSDLNKLKKSVGVENYEFTNLINEVYTYVNLAVIMCFNKEIDFLNKKIQFNNMSIRIWL